MDEQKTYWLDDSSNMNKLCLVLYVISGLLILGDFFYHKHIHFSPEGWFGFYALFGFLSYSFIVLAGWVWRSIVMRKEDYYDG
jgi:hypothetical protein